ncbi:MAG: DUF952 domain-containing protein [Pseudobdellovibrionaceae bacterium]
MKINSIILHITKKSEWDLAVKIGYYVAPSLENEGFIHCSLTSQVLDVANFKYKGQSDLVLLEIDESRVAPKVTYEDLYNLNELYPHIYGPLNVDAVVRVIPFHHQKDGSFELPQELCK